MLSFEPPSQPFKHELGCGWPLHQHFWLWKPAPVHGSLTWFVPKLTVPVESGRNGIANPPPETFSPELGGQSLDVGPNGPLPCTWHGGLPVMSDRRPMTARRAPG